MASVSGAQTSRTLLDILPQFARSKIEVGSVRLKPILGVASIQSTSSRFPKLEECAHFHYDHVDLPPMQLSVVEEGGGRGEFEGVTLEVRSGNETWQVHRTYAHFCKLDEQLHQCVFDRKFSQLPVLKNNGPKTQEETRTVLSNYVGRLSAIGSGCAISCGPALTWFELDNRGRRLVGAGNGINTPAVAAAFATTAYTAHANDELSFQTGDMISVIDMPPAEESAWWRGKRGFVVGFFPSNCVAVITDKIPNEIALAGPTKPVLRKHGKLIAFFRAFILSRPSRRRLKQSGILRERVFGCDLSEHLLNSGRDIPLVLKCCAEFIEAHGIVDGIYRLSGVTSNIQRLRSTFDEDRVPVLTEDSGIRQDIHSVASLLKMYFRELPNPLCTYQLYDEFVAAVQSPQDSRLDNMRRVVQKLPPPHYRTLEYLMGHLGRVCGHSRGTGMTARNVAIVWAPNLLRCKSLDQGVAALQGVGVQAVVTEFLILYAPHIFGHQPGEGTRARPKSLAVCTPTKLLPLHEAQMREQQSPTRSETRSTEVPTSYHTVLELPRKRQTLTWRAIFTPLRSTQGKSSHRIKHKNVVKSAEFLGMAKVITLAPQGSMPSSSTHSRSVSHDSYFDTVLEQPSTSSLIDTQHEGLSLSLDLSELQMNFELEESEMKIFSEDETNQLFSSGTSIAFGALDTESNLEQRFSNQELRYIDSYSPDPMESPSEDPLTPGYQPLISPNSYENLKVNSDARNTEESGTSSKKSDTSPCPYPYKELSDSSNTMEEMQRKENDLYESCPDNNNSVKNNNIYESVESEQEMYEPIMVASDPPSKNLYQNEGISVEVKSDAEDSNIYEDVQLSPSEIYEQVSYLRCSVEEVNRLVEETKSDATETDEAQIQNSTSSTSQGPNTGILGEDDISSDAYENVGEDHESGVKEIYSVYDKVETVASQHNTSQQELCSKQCMTAVECEKPRSSDIGPLEPPKDDILYSAPQKDAVTLVIEGNIDDLKSPVKLKDAYEKNANVPELYECVDFEHNKVVDAFCETEYERVNFSTSMVVCENKCDKDILSDIKSLEEYRKEKPKKLDTEAACDNLVSDKMEIEKTCLVEQPIVLKGVHVQKVDLKDRNTTDESLCKINAVTSVKIPCTVVSELLKEDCPGRSREKVQRKSLSLDLRPDYNEREVGGKTEKLRLLFEKEIHSTKPDMEQENKEGSSRSEMSGAAREDTKKTERKLSIEESEAERRERIEKYKEERRSFFRNKYKTDNINNNDDDDELIRRIKQKTKLKEQREPETEVVVLRRRSVDKDHEVKRSPSKTTVTISYSPTRTKLSGDWTPTSQDKKSEPESRTKFDKSQSEGAH